MKILITGGTGFIGSALVQRLESKGYEVNILTRSPRTQKNYFYWDYQNNEIEKAALDGVEGIIHLAGATVSKRWTREYKKEMYSSRVESIGFLEKELLERNASLQFLISASGVNYYGTETTQKCFIEEDEPGNDFLSRLCVDWEKATHDFAVPTAKKVILRTGIVLSEQGGAMEKLLPSFRKGAGAVLGKGDQVMPCIGLEDLVSMYVQATQDLEEGVYNAVAFNNTQKEFSRQLAQKLNKPLFLRVPAFVLRMAMGEMSSILLEGSAMDNQKIKASGFQFEVSSIEDLSL